MNRKGDHMNIDEKAAEYKIAWKAGSKILSAVTKLSYLFFFLIEIATTCREIYHSK